MAYECKHQNEVQSALWTHGSVTLFIVACFFDDETQIFLICTDFKHKIRSTIAFFEHI